VQLSLENPDFRYVLRGTEPGAVLVNERRLTRSFIVSPQEMVEDWRPRTIADLQVADMEPVLAMEPVLVLVGSGERLVFPAQRIVATCLTRGIGIEVMDNAAAARTFDVLAAEGRKVVAAFLL
jgi:uncharacterized protein